MRNQKLRVRPILEVSWRRRCWVALAVLGALGGCSADPVAPPPVPGPPVPGPGNPACDPQNGGISLPAGFCASIFADGLGRARHLTVTPAGDVFVAINPSPDGLRNGEVVALRDGNADGVADETLRFSDAGGNGIAWRDGYLYLGENGRIVRWAMPDGQLEPTASAEVIVDGLPMDGDHVSKTVVFDQQGNLLVNIGSASNSCQEENRAEGSPGMDPCPELAVRAGVWRFDAVTPNQVQGQGARVATGLRNMVALAIEPTRGALYGVQNGRDQLFENWPLLFTEEDDRRLPSEELFEIVEDADYGWPYCFHDAERNQKVLAPEYGGDGEEIGRCAAVMEPERAFPAHWAPLSMLFYTGTAFPEQYRNGAFIAWHGSRFEPEAEGDPGYQVAFVPYADGRSSGDQQTFAGDFAGPGRPLPDQAEYRPVGLAQGPDGALYISDDVLGRIWKVHFTGP